MFNESFTFHTLISFRIKLAILFYIISSILILLIFKEGSPLYYAPLLLAVGSFIGFKQNYTVTKDGLFFSVGFSTRNHLKKLGSFEAKTVTGFDAILSSLSLTSRQLIFHSQNKNYKINLLVSENDYKKICDILIDK